MDTQIIVRSRCDGSCASSRKKRGTKTKYNLSQENNSNKEGLMTYYNWYYKIGQMNLPYS